MNAEFRPINFVSRKILLMLSALAVVSFVLVMNAMAQDMSHNHLSGNYDPTAESETIQDWAKQKLAKSPRHKEWVKVKNGTREVNSFIVYPETNKKATAVIVIHEIFGMSDWVQQMTDELAEAGYIAIAPDLLSGMGPNGGGTAEIAATGNNAVGQAIRALTPDQLGGDLNAVADYVAKLPSANGKVVAGGFCWGGSTTFLFATRRPTLKAAFVFYGSAPNNNAQGAPYTVDKAALGKIGGPVYGFYAENDMRINATIDATDAAMKELKKTYDPVKYAGAGHGFMRAGEPNAEPPKPPTPKGDEAADKKAMDDYQKMIQANRKAHDDAWKRWMAILAKI